MCITAFRGSSPDHGVNIRKRSPTIARIRSRRGAMTSRRAACEVRMRPFFVRSRSIASLPREFDVHQEGSKAVHVVPDFRLVLEGRSQKGLKILFQYPKIQVVYPDVCSDRPLDLLVIPDVFPARAYDFRQGVCR